MAEAGCISPQQLDAMAAAAQRKVNLQPVIVQCNEEGSGIIIRDALRTIETAGGVLKALSERLQCSVAEARTIAILYIEDHYVNPKSLASALRQFGVADAETILVLR